MKHKSFRALVLAVPSSGLLLARPFLHFLCLNIYQPHSFLSTGLLASGREGNGTHSSTLTWGIPGTEEPGGRSPWGCEELISFPGTRKDKSTTLHSIQLVKILSNQQWVFTHRHTNTQHTNRDT